MKDIDRAGIAAIVEQAIAIAGKDAGGLHVSFDLDVCDPSIAPGVGTPVKGGFNYREAHMLDGDGRRLRPPARAGSRRGEPDPRRSEHDGHSWLGARLVALGQRIL